MQQLVRSSLFFFKYFLVILIATNGKIISLFLKYFLVILIATTGEIFSLFS